ncbi:MAG: universal stress protein [Candidatus Methanofastidiosa archaeon]|nr:universal stress protein [Candidatus Methanofastidiosa archaeon]
MYKHILACVDGSYDSEVAAKYALGMAKEAGSKITILTVMDERNTGGDRSLERLKRISERRDIAPTYVQEWGDQLERTLSFAESKGIDAIIASSGGKVKINGYFPNNFSQKLITSTDLSVFIIKSVMATTARSHKKLLCPIQSATQSLNERIEALTLISRMYDCPLSLFRCHKINKDEILSPSEKTRLYEGMKSYLQPLKERFDKEDVRTYLNTRICYSIREEILDYIKRYHYDLLFLRVTPGKFPSFARRDFSIEVMKDSECNVILWKPNGA